MYYRIYYIFIYIHIYTHTHTHTHRGNDGRIVDWLECREERVCVCVCVCVERRDKRGRDIRETYADVC